VLQCKTVQYNIVQYSTIRGHAVAQLVEALHYKPEGRGFDSSNRNEYQECFLGGVKAAGA
jgi:hypothetical protein